MAPAGPSAPDAIDYDSLLTTWEPSFEATTARAPPPALPTVAAINEVDPNWSQKLVTESPPAVSSTTTTTTTPRAIHDVDAIFESGLPAAAPLVSNSPKPTGGQQRIPRIIEESGWEDQNVNDGATAESKVSAAKVLSGRVIAIQYERHQSTRKESIYTADVNWLLFPQPYVEELRNYQYLIKSIGGRFMESQTAPEVR